MTVQAQDAGKPMLSSTVTVYVNVIDENDNAPVFETNGYNVDVYENATVNTVVATATATDRDSGKHWLPRIPPTAACAPSSLCAHGGDMVFIFFLKRFSFPLSRTRVTF